VKLSSLPWKWSPDDSLLVLIGLAQYLEDLLRRNVDVLTDASVSPTLPGGEFSPTPGGS
jgi:predicted nucleotidyltransferase